MLQKLTTTFFDARSGLSQRLGIVDDKLEHLLFFLTISLFTISSFLLIRNKYILKNIIPPLPPSPRGLPLVGNLLSLNTELHTCFKTLSQTYGPILTLRLGGKVTVVVTSPAIAREVLKDHDITFANRDVPVAARIPPYGGKDIVWTPYGPEWRMLRKVCVREMLSNATLDSAYALRREEIRKTIGYLYKRVGSPVNIREQMFLTVFSAITSMLWGGTVEDEEERGDIRRDLWQVVTEMTDLLGKPNISDFYPGLARFDFQGVERKMKGLVQRFEVILEAIVRKKLKMDGSNTKDFLHYLLKLKDEGNEVVPFTLTHLKALLMDMVVGGNDTTSSTIEFVLAEMMSNPQIMKKARQELDEIVGKNSIVEEYHIKKLPYLYAVMKEALRLHPALPLLVPHCPSKSCIIGGYTIPKGTCVLFNVWAIHRDPSIWRSPLEFLPERFLNEEMDFRGKDLTYFPFGSGRRICAGVAMVERMVMFTLASLLHSFDWKLADGEKIDLSEKFGIVLQKKVPLVLIPVPRLLDPELYM